MPWRQEAWRKVGLGKNLSPASSRLPGGLGLWERWSPAQSVVAERALAQGVAMFSSCPSSCASSSPSSKFDGNAATDRAAYEHARVMLALRVGPVLERETVV
jgi:hypothetical protein